MAFPDRIERTLEFSSPPATVWAAITTADGLSSWFGQQTTIDLRPGGVLRMSWDDGPTHEMRVEHVDEPRVFAFTWSLDGVPADDPRCSYVEFTLHPTDAGTRLTVVESGFAQLADDLHENAFGSHSQGWTAELGELAAYLEAA